MSAVNKSGYIAIIGRPNVGKSTLLNSLFTKKLSITSQTSQTTRGCVSANMHDENFSCTIIDTPGYLDNAKHLIDKVLNKSVLGWIDSADLILFIAEAKTWSRDDEQLLSLVATVQTPVLLLLNKVDLLANKDHLLPIMEKLSQHSCFREIVPISAKKNINIQELKSSMLSYLSSAELVPQHILLPTPDNVIIAERIREKIFRYTAADVPRNTAVVVTKITHKKNVDYIKATIVVDRKSHRKIIIGAKGNKLATIGKAARLDLEQHLNKKVYLELFVEVEDNWVNKEKKLNDYQIFYNQQY